MTPNPSFQPTALALGVRISSALCAPAATELKR